MTVKLFPHQEDAVRFLLSKRRAILADQPRVGKTLPTAVAALEHTPVLVICPAIVKTVWRDAIGLVNPDATVLVVNGKKGAESITKHDVVIINYDLLPYMNERLFPKFQTLVLDECHRIKSHTAKRTKVAMKAMAAISRVYALSGTIVPNRPAELWPILNGLGIYRNGWHDFVYRYCNAWNPPWGGIDVSGASNLPELKAMVRPHLLRRTKADVFNAYQQPQVSLITFDLPVDKREQDFDADVLVANPDALMNFEGLSEIMREAGMRKVKPSIEFIEDLLNGEEKLVVFAHHKDVVKELEAGLKKYKPVTVTGETPRSKRDSNITKFQSGDSRVIIGNAQSMGEGVDLSTADTIVFVETTWQTSALEQASSRVENISKSGTTPLIYLLTTRASLDHNVLKKLLHKQSIIAQII